MIGQWNPIRVFDGHPKDGITLHFKAAISECTHGIDPRLLGRIHKTGVDPTGHLIDLQK